MRNRRAESARFPFGNSTSPCAASEKTGAALYLTISGHHPKNGTPLYYISAGEANAVLPHLLLVFAVKAFAFGLHKDTRLINPYASKPIAAVVLCRIRRMYMNLANVIARDFQPASQTYDWRDAALYALSLGMGTNPTDECELRYVYEGGEQHVVPSMCVTLGWPPLWISEPRMEIAWTRVLHGEQRFELHRPLSPGGTVRATYRVAAIRDKGPGRGAVLYFETNIADAATGAPIATLTAANYLRDDGGCGSFGDAPPALPELPTQDTPDHVIDYPTSGQQALLYRLASRDYMPIHADPQLAHDAGFARPISHGLNTLGLACRAIINHVPGPVALSLRTMAARFVSPAYPGDTIRVELFRRPGGFHFRARAVERQVIVLDRGDCDIPDRS
jgi:acyl dehydratase